jgi:hypothetical protein
MKFNQVNIKTELLEQKQKNAGLLDQVATILSASIKLDEDVLYRLQHAPIEQIMDVASIDETDKVNLFNINQIKAICLKYNLRFLDSSYFKSEFPYEAISKIKAFRKQIQCKN